MTKKEFAPLFADRLFVYVALLSAMTGTINIAEGDVKLATEAYLASIATALLYVASRLLQVETRLNDDEKPPELEIIEDVLHAAPPAIFLGLGRLLYLSSQSQNKEQLTILLGVGGMFFLYSLLQNVKSVSR